jgi:hypothetical protein
MAIPKAPQDRVFWGDSPADRQFCRLLSQGKNATRSCRRTLRHKIGRACASTACTVKTDLDVSMAMRVISTTDGSYVHLDSELWHKMPQGRPPQRIGGNVHLHRSLLINGIKNSP